MPPETAESEQDETVNKRCWKERMGREKLMRFSLKLQNY